MRTNFFRTRLRRAATVAVTSTFAALLINSVSVAASGKWQAAPQGVASTSSSATRPVGAIKAINGKFITLTTDAGAEVTVIAQDATRFLRVAPGQKDLKDASPTQLQDLQVGDRILVRGKLADDSKSLVAVSIVVIKRTDVEAKQQREREDWQKRGVGGLVNSIDPATGVITVSTTAAGAPKTVAVRSSKDTVLRRYAPDSVKFDDAKPGTLDQIKPGDQLRARGNRNADGSDLTAEEIVSGLFRNIAGTIASVDSAAGTITVTDLIAKKPVLVKITAESQLRKFSPEMAQRLAMRLRRTPGDAPAGGSPTGAAPGAGAPNSTSPQAGPRQRGGGSASAEFPSQGQRTGGENRPMRPAPAGKQDDAAPQQQGQRGAFPGRPPGEGFAGGPPDLQQILSRMPAASIADLQKGDAVMIVSTQGSTNGEVTAITLLGGVEPILASSGKGNQVMVLSPWSLGQGGGEAAGTP